MKKKEQKLITSGVVWIETIKGNWHPFTFNVSDNGTTKKNLEEYVRKQVPKAKSIIIVQEKDRQKRLPSCKSSVIVQGKS